MIVKKLKILNKLGLHARAAAKVVSTANEFESDIVLVKDGKNADASIMKLLMLSASQGSYISIEVDGVDQKDAMKSMVTLLIINLMKKYEHYSYELMVFLRVYVLVVQL